MSSEGKDKDTDPTEGTAERAVIQPSDEEISKENEATGQNAAVPSKIPTICFDDEAEIRRQKLKEWTTARNFRKREETEVDAEEGHVDVLLGRHQHFADIARIGASRVKLAEITHYRCSNTYQYRRFSEDHQFYERTYLGEMAVFAPAFCVSAPVVVARENIESVVVVIPDKDEKDYYKIPIPSDVRILSCAEEKVNGPNMVRDEKEGGGGNKGEAPPSEVKGGEHSNRYNSRFNYDDRIAEEKGTVSRYDSYNDRGAKF